jgi:hypothetical protein
MEVNKPLEDNKQLEYKFICDKCDYKCNFISQWNNHCERESHKTGKRKTRTDKKEVGKCKDCDYNTTNYTNMLKHILNKHSTREERKEKFKFYCELCDFGSFSKDTIEVHNNSEKHKTFILRNKK